MEDEGVFSTTVQFKDYFDFETETICQEPDCEENPDPSFDVTFVFNNSGSFMYWNEGFATMAFVYNKSFSDLSFQNIQDYHFCQQYDDPHGSCVDVSSLPISFVALFKTNEGNYYAVQHISEDRDKGVTFRYKLLE